jgi:uncharacterized membrane protein
MTTEDESGVQRGYGVDRILGLTDAVFAFVVTLLVLDLAAPSLSPGATSLDLWAALSDERIAFLDYGISFLIAGAWWNGHHRSFSYIRDSDTKLRWLNLLFLLWITLLPFFTKLFSENPSIQLGYVLYAIDQSAAGFSMTLLWWYATGNHRFVDKSLSDETIRLRLLANVLATLWFILSIAVTFGDLNATYIVWCSVFLLPGFERILTRGRRRRKAKKKPATPFSPKADESH